jgi:hypothetical protein
MEVEQPRQCSRATVSRSPQTGHNVNIVLIGSTCPAFFAHPKGKFWKVNLGFDYIDVVFDFRLRIWVEQPRVAWIAVR